MPGNLRFPDSHVPRTEIPKTEIPRTEVPDNPVSKIPYSSVSIAVDTYARDIKDLMFQYHTALQH